MGKTAIIIGNIFSLCAMISDSISGTRKKHSEIMAVQIVSQFFYGASSIVLKGYSSTAQNLVAVFRNFAAMKNVKSKVLEWGLILAGVVLGIVFNNRGLLGWLPIVANLEYSIAVFKLKDNEKALKLAFIVNMVMYAIFSLVIMNYVGTLSCTVIAVTTAVSLIRAKKEQKSRP
ncbi:MAG: YgjV family protein [Firmicutes bacterium]|nr:YgjV family protein [Bacillota bacterium]